MMRHPKVVLLQPRCYSSSCWRASSTHMIRFASSIGSTALRWHSTTAARGLQSAMASPALAPSAIPSTVYTPAMFAEVAQRGGRPASAVPPAIHPSSSTATAANLKQVVFCSINGKTYDEHSSEITLLRTLGFGIAAERLLCVVKPDILNNLSEQLRAATPAKAGEMMRAWPRWLRSSVGNILLGKRFSEVDPATEVKQLLERKVRQHNLRKAALDVQNTVGGADETASATDASGAATTTPSIDDMLSIALNAEQAEAVKLAQQGCNLYIGGSAGTGKTVLIREIVRTLQAMGLRVGVTATTGIAGCHIGGSTFHHALGATVDNEFVRREELVSYNVVIIDEISMMSQRLFEEFDRCARAETGCGDLPFGGIQVILCGDFLQLGAIKERSILHSRTFQEYFTKFKLQTQVRQSEHAQFASMLSVMRKGVVPPQLIPSLKKLPPGTLEPSAVNLLPTNADVADANAKELARLKGDPIPFSPLPQSPRIMKRTSATLVLQVTNVLMFSPSVLQQHVVNVVEQKVSWPSNTAVSIYQQYADAYALRIVFPDAASQEWCAAANSALLDLAPTIHDLGIGARLFEVYEKPDGRHPTEAESLFDDMLKKHPVAQSTMFKIGCRVLLRSNLTTGLVNGTIGTVTDFVPCAVDSIPTFLRDSRVDDLVEKYRQFCEFEGMSQPLLPVVRFHTGEEIAVPPVEFSVGGFASTAHYSSSTIAIPLTLAYAFTVHKVQGLTLVGRVHLELSKMWPCDHLLYVAMSRVKDPGQLSLSGFEDSMVRADPMAVAFDERLPSVYEPLAPSIKKVSVWKAMELQATHGVSIEETLRTFGCNGDDAAALVASRRNKNASRQKTLLHEKLDLDGDDASATPAASPKKVQVATHAKKRLMRIVKLAEQMRDRRKATMSVISATSSAGLAEPQEV